jgi:hypothetical protein
MALPNDSLDKIKVYPNEYINNITINRGNSRLLENDKYLYALITALRFQPVPATTTSPGLSGDRAIDNNFLYFHNGTQWGRIALDTNF